MFLKITFFHTSACGHTRYKSCETCHLLSFPLVRTHVGEQLFLFSTHCFLLLAAVLRGKKSFSAEYKINLMRLSLVFVNVMCIVVSFSSLCWLHKRGQPAQPAIALFIVKQYELTVAVWVGQKCSNKKQQNGVCLQGWNRMPELQRMGTAQIPRFSVRSSCQPSSAYQKAKTSNVC